MFKKYVFYLLALFLASSLFAAGTVVVIEVTPNKVILKPGQKYTFKANAFDEEGNEVFFIPEWQASGGTINQDGVYIAGSNTGVYEIIASYSENGAHSSTTVRIGYRDNYYVPPKTPKNNQNTKKIVTTSKLQSLQLIPRSISVRPRQKIQFIVQAYDNFGNRIRPPKRMLWKVSGGSITQSGLYQAGGASGSYSIQVGNYNGISANAQVYINMVPGRISRINVSPASVTLKPGDQYRFFATAYNSAGQIMAFNPRWEASGGSIDSNGRFYAYNAPGTYTVSAYSNNNRIGTATVTIANTLVTDAEIYPKGAILYPGETKQFLFKAYGRDGAVLNLYPSWSATGGVIQANGLYRAGNIPGNYTLTASAGSFNVNVSIKIRNESRLSRIQISPNLANLRTGQSFQFSIAGYDNYGNKIKIKKLNIESNGGVIDANGLYIAGKNPGRYVIKISTPLGFSSSAEVNIAGDQGAIQGNTQGTFSNNTTVDKEFDNGSSIDNGSDIDSSEEDNSSSDVDRNIKWLTIAPQFAPTIPGRKTQFSVKAYDATGKEIPCQPTWRSSGGKINTAGMYTAGSKLGDYKVQVRVGSVKALAKVIINEPPKNVVVEPKKDTVPMPKANPLVVIPPKVRLKPGEKCNFNAQVSGEVAQKLKLKWTAEAGKINDKGSYVAPNNPGEYTIVVEDEELELKREVQVIVEGHKPETQQQFGGYNSVELTKWYVKTNKSGLASIHIKGKVLLKDTAMLKLLLHRNNDEELVYQLRIKEKQRFTIQGTHYVAGATKLELVLYNSSGDVIHRESK